MPTLTEYTGEACAVANNDNNINDDEVNDEEVSRPRKKHKIATETEDIEVVNDDDDADDFTNKTKQPAA